MALLVSSPRELEKYVNREEYPQLFEYLSLGGILRLETREGKVVILYPTREMIDERIRELEEKRRIVLEKLRKLRGLKREGRLLDGLRIRHRILRLLDGEYRELTDKIDVKELFENERGRKILDRLQRDKEYRERVREALEKSPVYRSTLFGSFARKTKEMKESLIGESLKKWEEIKERIGREISVLKALRPLLVG